MDSIIVLSQFVTTIHKVDDVVNASHARGISVENDIAYMSCANAEAYKV